MKILVLAALVLSANRSPASAAHGVAPLATFEQAEAYAAMHGITLTSPEVGVQTRREGAVLYDETRYVANGAGALAVLRFADAAKALEMAPVLVEADPTVRVLVRGRILFLVHGDASLLSSLSATPTATPRSFDDADRFLLARGLAIAAKTAASPRAGPELVDYTLAGGAKVSVYRFEDMAAATTFRDRVHDSQALASGQLVFVLPADAEGRRVFEVLAAK